MRKPWEGDEAPSAAILWNTLIAEYSCVSRLKAPGVAPATICDFFEQPAPSAADPASGRCGP